MFDRENPAYAPLIKAMALVNQAREEIEKFREKIEAEQGEDNPDYADVLENLSCAEEACETVHDNVEGCFE